MKRHLFDGSFLRLVRDRNGLTLEELARRCGTSKSYVWELENGKNTEPYSDLQFFRILETVFLSCDDVGCYTTVVGEYKNDRPKLIRENYSTYEYYRQMCIEEIKSLWMETIP